MTQETTHTFSDNGSAGLQRVVPALHCCGPTTPLGPRGSKQDEERGYRVRACSWLPELDV